MPMARRVLVSCHAHKKVTRPVARHATIFKHRHDMAQAQGQGFFRYVQCSQTLSDRPHNHKSQLSCVKLMSDGFAFALHPETKSRRSAHLRQASGLHAGRGLAESIPMLLFVSFGAASWLLLALPQSSSTSAMLQLGDMSGLRALQSFPCWGWDAARRGYARDSTWFPMLDHGDVCELNSSIVSMWVRSDAVIFKQHMTPSAHNVQLLLHAAYSSGRKLVVLNRNPYDAMHGLCERELKQHTLRASDHTLPRPAVAGARVHLREVQETFAAWVAGWEAVADAHKGLFHMLRFEDTVFATGRERVLKGALEHWGIPTVNEFDPEVCAHCINAQHEECAHVLGPRRRRGTGSDV